MFLLHVALTEIEPPIWRRVAVSGDMSLHALHGVVQTIMGWQDYHLYDFTVHDTRYEGPGGDDRDSDLPDPRSVRLEDLGLKQGSQFWYTYDFGDDWRHVLTVEGIAPQAGSVFLPLLLGGARACPPEDCGGPGGYAELLEAFRTPTSVAGREAVEWLGRPFDSEALDLAALARVLGGPPIRPGRRRRRRGRAV